MIADDFDDHLAKFYLGGGADRPLVLDFRQASFIEIAVLVNCVATLLQRSERDLPTRLRYPQDSRVRDFLRIWRFSDAVRQATGHSIHHFLETQEDRELATTPQAYYTGIGDAIDKLEYDPDWESHKKTSRNFFEFVTFTESKGERIDARGRFTSAPREESRKWTRPLIRQVLDKHLTGESAKDEVARVIVYEALSNAVRHPGARTIQVVSKFEKPGERMKGSAGFFRICVWDDGESIAKTLIDALNEGRTIHAIKLPPYMCDKVHVTIRSFDKKIKHVRVVDQSEQITKDTATEGRVLLASLFPGVTRTVSKEIPKVEPFEGRTIRQQALTKLVEALAFAPGMGLYALTRTVIDQFTGSLVIRSGKYRLIIEAAHDLFRVQHSVRYKCKVTQYPHVMPPFRGNLLTVQLPLRQRGS